MELIRKEICGGQSSGKTLIANYISNKMTGRTMTIIEEDFFMGANLNQRKKSLSLDKETLLTDQKSNFTQENKLRLIEFSQIESYDWEKFCEIIQKLKNKESTLAPKFDTDNDRLLCFKKDFRRGKIRTRGNNNSSWHVYFQQARAS